MLNIWLVAGVAILGVVSIWKKWVIGDVSSRCPFLPPQLSGCHEMSSLSYHIALPQCSSNQCSSRNTETFHLQIWSPLQILTFYNCLTKIKTPPFQVYPFSNKWLTFITKLVISEWKKHNLYWHIFSFYTKLLEEQN